jgi:hypothetical protein
MEEETATSPENHTEMYGRQGHQYLLSKRPEEIEKNR